MYNHFEVLTEALRKAGAAALSASEQASSLTICADMGELISTALPGSVSVGSASDVAGEWNSRLKSWAESANDFAEHIGATADVYDDTDQSAHDHFRRILDQWQGGK